VLGVEAIARGIASTLSKRRLTVRDADAGAVGDPAAAEVSTWGMVLTRAQARQGGGTWLEVEPRLWARKRVCSTGRTFPVPLV